MQRLNKLAIMLFSLNAVILPVQASMVKIQNIDASLVQNSHYLKPMELNKEITFTVWLKLRNEGQLAHEVDEIYDPNSAKFQHFLTYDELEQHYAPERSTEDKIQDYFVSHGLKVNIVHHNLRVTGTVKQIEKVLKVKFNYYRYNGQTIYSIASTPSLSSDIAPFVLQLSGLSNIPCFKSQIMKLPDALKFQHPSPGRPIDLAWKAHTPYALPTSTSFNGFSGATLRTAYKLNNIPPVQGNTINGAGQTIVINDFCGLDSPAQITANANDFNSSNGLPLFTAANFAIVNPDGTPFISCGTQSQTGWEAEIALDIESAHAVAPGANIVLVLTTVTEDLGTSTINLVNNLISQNFTIAGFKNASIISNSWAGIESPYFSFEPWFQEAAASGLNLNFSTGDCGDNTYSSGACGAASNQPVVNYPASSVYTTAVGGTSAFVDNNWNYAFEAVWGLYWDGFYYGGGGGVSGVWGPPNWQSSISNFMAGGYNVINKRALPDISMLADPGTGLIIYITGGATQYGGTSLSSPLFAGMLALVNQVRFLNKKSQLGLAAPYLYTNITTLLQSESLNVIEPPHQIISGSTLPPAGAPNSAFSYSGFGVPLVLGWDSSLRTEPDTQFWNDGVGVGSPNAPNFVMTMAGF